MTDLDTRLSGCFQRVFPRLEAGRVATATPEALPEWDSLASISLLNLIEEEFDIPVDFEELARLDSFQAFSGYLRALLAGG